jgi:hypothetical protein
MRNPLKMDEERTAKWEQKYKDAVRDQVEGEPLAVGPFQRTGQWFLVIPGIGQLLGAVFYLVYQLFHKSRAAGLPSNFLLAVTPTKVYAFKYGAGYGKIKVRREVAVFNRQDVKVLDAGGGTLSSKVTLEANEDGETTKIVCSIPSPGMNPFSGKVVELLQAGPAAA